MKERDKFLGMDPKLVNLFLMCNNIYNGFARVAKLLVAIQVATFILLMYGEHVPGFDFKPLENWILAALAISLVTMLVSGLIHSTMDTFILDQILNNKGDSDE